MICPEIFYQSLHNAGIHFFAGVPDSLLKHLCACITKQAQEQHVITANEGGAVAMAMGYHLATNKIPCVYMQNSGLGHAINPLLSMADTDVYSIPMLLIVGWRGELDLWNQQIPDEPQHKKQGQVTCKLLDTMYIPYQVIGPESQDAIQSMQSLIELAQKESKPVALVIRKNTFSFYPAPQPICSSYDMTREQAISKLLSCLPKETFVVSTTGKTSRELFELRDQQNIGHDQDFLVVGSMGHASQIVAGIKHCAPDKRVVCLDGDGSCLMHLGSLTNNAAYDFCHIVLNNGAHESVGGQPTLGLSINLPQIALGCGYQSAISIETPDEILTALDAIQGLSGAHMVEIKIKQGSRQDLGRPTLSNDKMKRLFQQKIHYSSAT